MDVCHYWTQRFSRVTLTLVEHHGELVACAFGEDTRFLKLFVRSQLHGAKLVRRREPLLPIVRQLREYFAGERRTFDVGVALHGTAFQKRVWAQIRKIKYGETASYGDIARALGNPRLVRAVGGAAGANPVAIIVPCHRVIGSRGGLTGYGGGIDLKERLLQLEGVMLI